MAQDDRDRWLGVVLITASAIAYSLSGYFTRLIALDVFTVLFWRGLFGGLFIGAYMVWRHRLDVAMAVKTIGSAGVWVTGLSTLATISFINSLKFAPVSEVMTIHAAIPFLTAVLALVIHGERETPITWAASIVAMIGVGIMFDPTASASHLAGYGFAGVMALSYSAMIVIIRQNRHVSMLPAACLSAFLCALVVWPFARPYSPTGSDMVSLALFGTVQFGLGLLLVTIGTRLISATSSALIGSTENPLAPLWVWVAFGEEPTLATWIGGTLVMAAVVGDVALKSRNGGAC